MITHKNAMRVSTSIENEVRTRNFLRRAAMMPEEILLPAGKPGAWCSMWKVSGRLHSNAVSFALPNGNRKFRLLTEFMDDLSPNPISVDQCVGAGAVLSGRITRE